MKTLATRLSALEARAAPATPSLCPACGHPMDLSLPRVTRPEWTVGFGEDDDVPEHCPGCGRRQVFRISFDKGG